MTERAPLPLFVREALELDAGEAIAPEMAPEAERSLLALERALDAGAAVALEGALEGVAPGSQPDPVLARLEQTLSEAPHRYAPFYARAAELFDLSEDAVVAELARLRDPGAWKFAGLPGISHVAVAGGPRVKSAEALFVRFKPGVYFPAHQHTAVERVLVLEGNYQDSHGVLHRPGELREWAPGTDHSFRVGREEPCIFASVVFGRRFNAWTLRALARVLGR